MRERAAHNWLISAPIALFASLLTATPAFAQINDPPTFTSTVITAASEDVAYTYNITTTDPDVGQTRTITMPTGPAWLTLTNLNATNGTATLSGTPTQAQVGNHSVVLRVTDNGSPAQFAEQSFTVVVANVNDQPTFTSTAVTTASEGVVYTYSITTTDSDVGQTRTITIPTRPAWLNLTNVNTTNGTATLTGTPTQAQVGSHSVVLRVTDNGSPAQFTEQSFTVVVANVNDPPTFTSTAITAASEDVAYTYGITTTDPDVGQTRTITMPTGPAWLTLTNLNATNGTATLSGTPTQAQVGNHSVVLRVTDNGSPAQFAEQSFTVVVANVNDQPTFTSTAVTTASEGVVYTYSITTTDSDVGQTRTITIPTRPAWLNLTNVNTTNGTATLTGTPTQAQVGSHSVVLRVTDNGSPAQFTEQSFTVVVTNVNDAPVAVADPYNATEDTVLNIAAPGVLANDTDPDTGTVLTALVVTSVPTADGTLTLNGNGSFVFTPALNFAGPTTTFTYRARDNATPPLESATATVTITLAAVNDPPVGAVNRSYSTNEDVALAVAAPGLLTGVTDPEGNATTAVLVTPVPANTGLVTVSPNGSFVFTPAPNFAGPTTFTYVARDTGTPPAQSAVPGTVTITVAPVNDAPVATPNSYQTAEDTTLSVPVTTGVLANDTDPDGGTVLTAQLAAPPLHGTLVLNPNGSFTYTPNADYQGPDTFSYSALDNGAPPLLSATALVAIAVDSVNDPPRLAPGITALPNQTATENVALVPLTLAPFFVDAEGLALTFAVTGLPPGLSATPDGTIAGTPALNTSVGTFPISVVVSDGLTPLPATFNWLVLQAGRTDLALSIAVAPSPAVINQPVTWTFTIENRSPVEAVGNLALQAVFSGQVPFVLTPPPRCTATPQGAQTLLNCTAGPVAAAGTATLAVTGSSTQPGDVLVNARVSITDPLPVDATPDNDTASAALSIAQTLASGAGQTVLATDHRASAAGDLNGDGFVDLAVAAGGGQGTLIYPNVVDPANPTGTKRTLAAQPAGLGDSGTSTDITLADLDGDGALDLIVAKAPGPGIVFRNPKDGTFGFVAQANGLGRPGDMSNAVAARDVNGDGRIDVVLANSSPNRVLLNQGGGLFTEAAALGNDDSRDVVLANLFGDAALEFVFANATGAAIYSGSSYQEMLPVLPTGPTTSIAAGDFDADGRTDLVFGRASSNLVFLNTTPPGGAGQFFLAAELGAAPTTDVLATDTDADGDVDIVVIHASGGHQIYANNGAGQFTLHAAQFASKGALDATAAKLSSDDRVDVAVIGTAGIDVFYNDGAGNLGKGDTGAPTIQLLGPTSVDLIVEAPYADAGATATDAVDGSLTAKIVVTNPVNTAVIGTYTVSYNVVDTSGNAATPVTRTVRVAVRSGTGGGGGGAFDFSLALLLAMLVLARVLQRQALLRNSL